MKMVSLIIIACMFLGIVALYCFGIEKNALANWDEAWYADVSRTMAETKNLLTPTWNYGLFFDKPPLYYWISACMYLFFGDSEISSRLPSALAGIGSTILVCIIVYESTRSKISALISGIILSAIPGFVGRARTGNLDVLFTFWIVGTSYCWLKTTQSNRYRWWALMGLTLGLGFLSKGFGCIAFIGSAFIYEIITKMMNIYRIKRYIGSLVIFLLCIVAWVGPMYILFGNDFISTFFHHQSNKYMSTFALWKSFSFDMVRYSISGLKIWALVLFGILLLNRKIWKDKIFSCFILFIIIFELLLSFSVNKSNWFLVPIYPFVAMVIGLGLYRLFGQSKHMLLLCFSCVIFLSLVQLKTWQKEFFPPDVARNEAELASYAGTILKPDDFLYLTNYYYPTTAYYSRRKTLSVYADVQDQFSWWILPLSAWESILSQNTVYIITTDEERRKYQSIFQNYTLMEVYRRGDKILLKKI